MVGEAVADYARKADGGSERRHPIIHLQVIIRALAHHGREPLLPILRDATHGQSARELSVPPPKQFGRSIRYHVERERHIAYDVL